MSKEEQRRGGTNEVVKSLAGILSYFLPIAQFFYQLIPNAFGGIFPNSKIIFITSILTLLTSFLITIWYRQNPFIRFALFPWQNKKSKEYWKKWGKYKDEPSKLSELGSPPSVFYVTDRNLTLFLIFLVFILGGWFSWVVLNMPDVPSIGIVYLQAILYSLIILTAVFSTTIFYEMQSFREESENNKKRRASKAISLAIENNAILDIPSIRFIKEEEMLADMTYNIEVEVKEKKYRITTDRKAEILKNVNEIIPEKTRIALSYTQKPSEISAGAVNEKA